MAGVGQFESFNNMEEETMSLFKFGQALDSDQRQSTASEEIRAKAASFDLAGTGGFLSFVKYCVFVVLASLNFHLFYVHAPGVWGALIGCTALLFEACAVHFWNKQNKSAGRHKLVLQFFAVLFTVVSFVHGTAALYQLSGVGPSITPIVETYSRLIAFPLLFGLMVLAVCVLHYLHWSTEINEARANAVMRIEKDRAAIMTEVLELESRALVETERLGFFKKRVLLEEQYASTVEEFARVSTRGVNAVESISDPKIREEMLQLMGRTSSKEPAPKRIMPLVAPTHPANNQTSDYAPKGRASME